MNYQFSELPDPHIQRRKELMKKYPEAMRELMGPHVASAIWIFAIVAAQFGIAYLVRDQAWWVIGFAAFAVGAVLNHSLYVQIHETAHNLVFKSSVANRLIGFVCDFPLVLPSAAAFRKYHLMHHFRMGQMEYDADITSEFEGKLVGNSTIRKFIWVVLLGVSQAFRPMRIKVTEFWDRWIILNILTQAVAMGITIYALGWSAIAYLLASSIFGLGIHPLGARWIAEHFITTPGQETYSYYGPLNKVMFNVGHHNEHHDLMTIPWVNLPKLRKIAPEYYDTLPSYSSYSKLMFRFIFDPKMDLFSRVTRKVQAAEAA